jgi:hypothetical protein
MHFKQPPVCQLYPAVVEINILSSRLEPRVNARTHEPMGVCVRQRVCLWARDGASSRRSGVCLRTQLNESQSEHAAHRTKHRPMHSGAGSSRASDHVVAGISMQPLELVTSSPGHISLPLEGIRCKPVLDPPRCRTISPSDDAQNLRQPTVLPVWKFRLSQ